MNYTEQQLTAAVVSDGLRPAIADPELSVPSTLLSLIQRCWDTNSQNRPSFDEIIGELDLILKYRKQAKPQNMILTEAPVSYADQHKDFSNNYKYFEESINWSAQGEHFSKKASYEANICLTSWLDCSCDPVEYRPVLSWGSFATCGRRETMEDTHFLLPHMCNEKDIFAFGIFDGHRGT